MLQEKRATAAARVRWPITAPCLRPPRARRSCAPTVMGSGLSRAAVARMPRSRRRRTAASCAPPSSRGRLSRRIIARPTLAPRRRAAACHAASSHGHLLSRLRRATASRAVVVRPPLARRRCATASRAVVALRPLAPLSRDGDYDNDDDNADYDGYLGTNGKDGGREAGCGVRRSYCSATSRRGGKSAPHRT